MRTNQILILFLPGLFIFNSCVYIQKRLDRSGINDLSTYILENYQPGSPEKLKKFLSNASLNKITRIAKHLPDIKKEALNKWPLELKDKKNKVISEKWSFNYSSVLNEHGKTKNLKSYFYIFRTGKIENSKTILWVPGMGVNDFAFRFIKKIFIAALDRGINIIFFVPPYHLERISPGKEEGEGFFTANTKSNLAVILNSVKELRIMTSYLKSKNVKSIGGWGGSMGATMLMLASSLDKNFQHLVLMIPVLNWNSIVSSGSTKSNSMNRVLVKLKKSGFTRTLLNHAYNFISPDQYNLGIQSSRVLLQYAKLDQLTSEKQVIAYAKKNNISNIESYNKSHATILLSSRLYKNYAKFLDKQRK